MIIKTVEESIFKTDARHVAFPISTEGINNTGFAEEIANQCWPELKKYCHNELGSVISKKIGDKTYHALVCHTLETGWNDDQSDIIKQCFDAIESNGEPIATLPIGTRFYEKILGANFKQIIYGMHNSEQKIMLHTNHTLDDIMIIYQQIKQDIPQKIKFIRQN